MTKKTYGLRARREEAGLSRERLARLVGCSTATITQYENVPSPVMAQRIADALDCQPSDLFNRIGR
jgi:transcriptional regulator with XRE-family HTH domain